MCQECILKDGVGVGDLPANPVSLGAIFKLLLTMTNQLLFRETDDVSDSCNVLTCNVEKGSI